MIKTLAKSIREYKFPSLITVFFMMGEVIIEAIIPFITADLVNKIKMPTTPIGLVFKTGLILVMLALLSLVCGGMGAVTGAKASTGFAKNLRRDMFRKIQSFSFSNID